MQQKDEKESHSISKKSSTKRKDIVSSSEELDIRQVDEGAHNKIPSFMTLLRQSPDYDCTRKYFSAYIEYITHFTQYQHLNTQSSLEIAQFCSIIKKYLEANRNPDEFKVYLDFITQLLLANDVNGSDEVYLYTLLDHLLDNNPDYGYSLYLPEIKNTCFFKLLKGLELANNPKDNRSEYLVNKLISSIKNQMKLNRPIFNSNDEQHGEKLLELILSCLNLNRDDKYKKDLIYIVSAYLNSNGYFTSPKSPLDPDIVTIFRMGQFLIEQKEYPILKKLIYKYFDLNKNHHCLIRYCTCMDEQVLSALVYAVKLIDPIPVELKELGDLSFYKKLGTLKYPSVDLEEWDDFVVSNYLNDFDSNYVLKSKIIAHLFISSVIKNYSAKELINYFLKVSTTLSKPITTQLKRVNFRVSFEEERKRQHYNSRVNFIESILKCLHEKDLKILDTKTKMDLMHLYKWCDDNLLSFDFFNLLHNLTKEEQAELINYYKVNFLVQGKKVDGKSMTSEFILNAYPLEISTKPPPPSEKNIAIPAGLYMECMANEVIIPKSFGCGLFQMEKDPSTLAFTDIEPLLKGRSAVISVNKEIFYADLDLKKVRKLKSTQDNQKEMSQLSSNCTFEYHLADEAEYNLIMSLTGVIPPFHGFIQLFNKKNQYLLDHAGEHNTVDYVDFMVTNAVKLMNFYEFMGEDVFLFMKKMLHGSPQNLERYFGNIILIPAEYFQLLQLTQNKFSGDITKGESRSYEVLLLLIGQLELMLLEFKKSKITYHFSKEEFLKKSASVLEDATSIQDLTEFVTEEISTLYKELLDLPEHCELDLSIFVKDPLLLSRLLTARKAMKDNKLGTVFDKLIEYDLRMDVGFTDFANNPNQEHSLGKNLSLHNQKIEITLSKAKINTNLAFNYPIVQEFSTGDSNEIDLPWLAKVLYADIKNLEQIFLTNTPITFFKEEEPKEYKEIRKSIALVKNQVEKKSGTIQINAILNGVLDKHINIIACHLGTLLKQDVSNSLREHGQHFIKHRIELIKAIKESEVQPRHNKEKKKNFAIIQWDKKLMTTFLLGDFLSCCLAPDGGQFPAMVQRRMDSAMMMHVVIDKELNQPVCGNWLFLAHDKKKPTDIYVVANFFEIRASYGLKKELSKKLVQELLSFTGQYAESIGAKGFIMRPLTYGMIPDFKGQYQTKEIEIEKVGGFFDPSLKNNQFAAVEIYYLDALYIDEFYVYEHDAYESQPKIVISSPTYSYK